jgi:hypothetical protein
LSRGLNAISIGIKAVNMPLGTSLQTDVQAAQTRISADMNAGPVQGPLVTIHAASTATGTNETTQNTLPTIPALSISNVSPLQNAFSNPALTAVPKS